MLARAGSRGFDAQTVLEQIAFREDHVNLLAMNASLGIRDGGVELSPTQYDLLIRALREMSNGGITEQLKEAMMIATFINSCR